VDFKWDLPITFQVPPSSRSDKTSTMTQYRKIAIQTYRSNGEASGKSIRARPLQGQGIATTMHVACSEKMRKEHPMGTVFIVKAKITNREGGPAFIYTSWKWPYSITTLDDAKNQIASGRLN
jgi:hypothetical protein